MVSRIVNVPETLLRTAMSMPSPNGGLNPLLAVTLRALCYVLTVVQRRASILSRLQASSDGG
jgi:hypothetical protein